MNMKILSIILILGSSLSAIAQDDAQKLARQNALKSALGDGSRGGPQKCNKVMEAYNAIPEQERDPSLKNAYPLNECQILSALSDQTNGLIGGANKDNTKTSADGKISCIEKATYTQDHDECVKALNYYSAVVVAETAMNVEQKVRTDLKNQNIAKKSQQEMANGQSQTAMFDAATESNNHQKGLQQEKMIAYSAAVAALVAAHQSIPSINKISDKVCSSSVIPADAKANCPKVMQNNRGAIAANDDAKSKLMAAIMDFTAKGLAAGIAMGQYGNAAKQIQQAKNSITDDSTDLMMEKCVLNPTDIGCAKDRSRTGLDPIASGDFGFGSGESNSFNMAPESSVTPEMGAETKLDENAPIAGVNTPFANDAKIAKGILDPAAGAQMQATGGAQGGGGGGGSGGGGGGGASLGSDLNGANKDGDKEAQIKTSKVAGTYSQGGGGGYKGVGKSKDDANPFASLFDAKGSGGGVEEDRSIASGDIDGAASGLFQKISKRYGQVQADKRLEAKNLE